MGPGSGSSPGLPPDGSIYGLTGDGKGRRKVAFATDTTEGILTIAPDGRMFATLGVMTTTSLAPVARTSIRTCPKGWRSSSRPVA